MIFEDPPPRQDHDNTGKTSKLEQSRAHHNEGQQLEQSPANGNEESEPQQKKDREPALQLLFKDVPKDCTKGFVMGSDTKTCDVLLGDFGEWISEQMLVFTYQKDHQLVMKVTADRETSVKFNYQEEAKRKDFTWILPRGQKLIHVDVF